MPKLRTLTFETALIQRYQRRETSVEEALAEMDMAGVSTRRIEDITDLLWDATLSAGTVSRLNSKVYEQIEAWRQRPLEGQYPYVYLDGLYLKRNWGGHYGNVAVLVAMAVREEVSGRKSAHGIHFLDKGISCIEIDVWGYGG